MKSKSSIVKAWRKKNPQKVKAQGRRYRKRHPVQCRETSARWRMKNRERERLRGQKYRKENPEMGKQSVRNWCVRNSIKAQASKRTGHLKHKYGITDHQYEARYQNQKGRCALCNDFYVVLCVDHDHRTGLFRGLLCVGCNWLLGRAKDSPSLLRKAAEYLELAETSNHQTDK